MRIAITAAMAMLAANVALAGDPTFQMAWAAGSSGDPDFRMCPAYQRNNAIGCDVSQFGTHNGWEIKTPAGFLDQVETPWPLFRTSLDYNGVVPWDPVAVSYEVLYDSIHTHQVAVGTYDGIGPSAMGCQTVYGASPTGTQTCAECRDLLQCTLVEVAPGGIEGVGEDAEVWVDWALDVYDLCPFPWCLYGAADPREIFPGRMDDIWFSASGDMDYTPMMLMEMTGGFICWECESAAQAMAMESLEMLPGGDQLKLEVPEPEASLMLLVGIATIGVLLHISERAG